MSPTVFNFQFLSKIKYKVPKLLHLVVGLTIVAIKSESPVRTTTHHWNSIDIFYFWSCSGTKIIIISSAVGWYKLLRTQKATSGKSLIAFQTPQEPRAHGSKYFWKVTFIFTQNRAKKVITVGKYFVCIYPLIWRWSTFIDKVIIEFGAGLWLLLIYSLCWQRLRCSCWLQDCRHL